MARARNIKPSFFKNELLGEADPLLGLLFISLWTLADKCGRLEDRPLRIKAETFPYRENVNINGYLTQLLALGFIDRYKVGETSIIEIVNFVKHQTPHSTEKVSELPCKPIDTPLTLINASASVISHINVLNPDSSNTDSLLLIPESECVVNCNSEENKKTHTQIQVVLISDGLKSIGMMPINPTLPKFMALVEVGATADEFVSTALEKRGTDKFNFNYLLTVMGNRRADAARAPPLHKGAMPSLTSREAGRNIAAKSVFTPENTKHLQGNKLNLMGVENEVRAITD